MIIAILATTVVMAACLAEMVRRTCVGRRKVEDMQRYEAPSAIRILGTEEEVHSALLRPSEAERLKARHAETRADHYATVVNSVTGRTVAPLAIGSAPATA